MYKYFAQRKLKRRMKWEAEFDKEFRQLMKDIKLCRL